MDSMAFSIFESAWSIIRRKLTKVLSIKTAPRRAVFSPIVDRLCCIPSKGKFLAQKIKSIWKVNKPWQWDVFQFR